MPSVSPLTRLFLCLCSCTLSATVSGSSQILVCHVPRAHAQHAPDPGNELLLIESTERSEDPLGIDESIGKELDKAAARLPKQKPVVVLPSASQGAALSSIPGVRESAHLVTVKLDQGLAFVKLRLTFVSAAKHAAELAYRLPLPARSVVTRVRVCSGTSCSEAEPNPRPDAGSQARSAAAIYAEPIDDARGHALALRIAPLVPSGTVEAQLEYVAEAPWLGGRARFRLLPRGYDPNLAPSQVQVEAAPKQTILPAAALSADAWTPLDLTASLPASALAVRSSTSAPCGESVCTRSFEASARAEPLFRPTWLLLDASPSMEGPARGRLSVVLAALLSTLPEHTEMRALAFAARASELGRFRAGAAPLTQLSDATMLDLDAATQLSSALALYSADVARDKPRIVVLSDGLFDDGPREREALATARRQGAETWLLSLADMEPRLTASFSHTLDLATLAEAATHGDDLGPLEDALQVVAARTYASGLKAGEQRVREQAPKRAWPLHAGSWLPLWLARAQPVPVWRSPLSRESAPTVAAIPYLSVSKPPPAVDTGLPKESVLTMLRTQLVPQARACLRSDRKGRAGYAVGLAFHALFAQREVYEARVEGVIPRALRTCLLSILPKLRVPAFSGRIRIRYPIYTEREAEPPVIELEPELSQQLERAFSRPRALP